MNVQAFEELKRVLRTIPESGFSLSDWDRCACGHATRDSWFQQQGFTKCSDFAKAAAFFEIPRYQAEELFSAPLRAAITPVMVIKDIDRLLAGEPDETPKASRRQAVIDDLLARANRAAREARRVATALVAALF
ncbi:MAG: hypothetical protein K0Q60_4005 [Microvirga sp.]|nr:hypothetical protein [Microvirga sp.]